MISSPSLIRLRQSFAEIRLKEITQYLQTQFELSNLKHRIRFRHHPLDPLTSFFANFTDFPIGSLSLSLSCQHRGTRVSAVSVAFIPNSRQAAITLDRNPLHEFPEFTFQTQLGYESNW